MATKPQQLKTEFLTIEELADRIDENARILLKMPGIEFVERLEEGKLEESSQEHYVRMLYYLAEETQRPAVLSRLRQCAQ